MKIGLAQIIIVILLVILLFVDISRVKTWLSQRQDKFSSAPEEDSEQPTDPVDVASPSESLKAKEGKDNQ